MPSHSFGREIANVALRVVAVVLCFIFILGFGNAWVEEQTVSDGWCNIAVLPIEGVIAPYGDVFSGEMVINPASVRNYLEMVQSGPLIEGVLFEINSPGGTPVAAEQIAELIDTLDILTVGVVGDMGASGGYLVAAATDFLVASPMSQVGSIGVTMSYLEQTKQNEEEGLTFVELAAGNLKEAGNPNKELTEEERARFERDLATVHDVFIDHIAKYRDLPREDVVAVADGSGYTGKDALEKRLVDALGGRSVASAYFAETLQMPIEDIAYCEYVAEDWWL
ncbi:S49 family peptidase [Patescibacteria group bacterium]|nr:S49 family peptidase [Patescibacteria group bacterium]